MDTLTLLRAMAETAPRLPGEGSLLSLLKVQPLVILPTQKEHVITVHMFNPHVLVVGVISFLARYVKGVGTCFKHKSVPKVTLILTATFVCSCM